MFDYEEELESMGIEVSENEQFVLGVSATSSDEMLNEEKYIFLDIDGVLRLDKESKHPLFDRESLVRLKQIITLTNAKIILTSDWKNDANKLRKIGRILNVLDLEIAGVIDGQYENRGKNILKYLSNHRNQGYVVIDDDEDIIKMQIAEFNYVITDSKEGITELVKEDVLRKLGVKNDMDYGLCRKWKNNNK